MATKTGTIALNSRTLYWRMTIAEDSYNIAANTSTVSYSFEYYMSAGSGGWADGNSIMFQLGINGYTSLINCFYVNGTLQSSIKNNQTYTNQAGTYKFNYLGGGSTYRTAKFCPKGQSGESADVIAQSSGTVTYTHGSDGSGSVYLQARFGMAGTGAAATKGTIHTMTSDTITLTDLRKTATVSAGTGATISPTTSSYQVNLNGSYTVSGNKLTLPIGSSTSSITASAQTGYNTPTWNRSSGTMTGDLTFTASATKLTYSVSYNKGDASSGTAPGAQTKTYGTALTLATNTGNLSKSSTSHSNNRTGQAITLSYNANGGTGAPSNNTGTGVTVPGTFTRSYTFNGWGTSSGTETVAYNAGGSYTANAAITLYPAWKHSDGSTSYTATSASATISSTKPTKANTDTNVTITVSYDANGGSGAPGNSTGTAVNTTPHPFSQWAAGSATGTKYNAGATYTESITASKTVTMYAIYGDGTTTRKSNPSITLSSTTPTRTGYSFQGWSTSSTATTKSYDAGKAYTFDANTKLYAVWSINTWSVSYNKGDATSGTAPSAQTKTYNQNLTLATNSGNLAHSSTSQSGTKAITVSYDANGGSSTSSSGSGNATTTATVTWTAAGWATSQGGAKAYDFGGTYSNNSAATLYPAWSKSTGTPSVVTGASITTAAAISHANESATGYSVTYDMAGGTGGPSAQTSGDRTVTYSFSKWNTNSSGTGTTYNANTSYSFSSDAKLYAIWTSTTGTTSSWSCPSAVPTKSGFDFVGWSTISTDTNPPFLPGQTYTITSDLKLYAIWKSSGSVRVDTGSGFKYGRPYVWTTKWVPGTAYMHDGSSWKKGV